MKFPVSSRLNRSSCLKKVFRTPFSPIDESEGLFFLEPGLPITQTNYCLANYSASTLFYYDGDGNPVKSVVNGETILFVGGHYEVSNPGSGQVITKYHFAGSQRVAMRKYTIPQPMTVNYSLSDHLGSTSSVTDSSGAKLSETGYKAWGEVRYATASQILPTRYTYTGEYSDIYINLLWYGSRYYDPELGRFIQPDSIILPGVQGLDRYAYANNNSVNFTDPSGHTPVCVAAVTNGICQQWAGLTEVNPAHGFESIPNDRLANALIKATRNTPTYDTDNDGVPNIPDPMAPPVQTGTSSDPSCKVNNIVECFYARHRLPTGQYDVTEEQLEELLLAFFYDTYHRPFSLDNWLLRGSLDGPTWDGGKTDPSVSTVCTGGECSQGVDINYALQGMISAKYEGYRNGLLLVNGWKFLNYGHPASGSAMGWFSRGYAFYIQHSFPEFFR